MCDLAPQAISVGPQLTFTKHLKMQIVAGRKGPRRTMDAAECPASQISYTGEDPSKNNMFAPRLHLDFS
jgi:hypothetical protein